MPKFKVTYARVVIMNIEVEADSGNEALDRARTMEIASKLPGVYPVPSQMPPHVEDIQDYEPIWKAERVEE